MLSNLTVTEAWWFPALALLGAALGLLAWSYLRQNAGPSGWIALSLRVAALLALAFCLLDPLWSLSRPRPGANLLAVVADNSQSLDIHDPGSEQSRGDVLRSLVAHSESGWQGTLAKTFEIRRYRFDSRLQSVPELKDIPLDGRSSNLGTALRQLAGRFKSRPLAGVILLTDGNATDLSESAIASLKDLPPVYPVLIGGDRPPHDVAIQEAITTLGAFEDAPVTVQCRVTADGFPDRKIYARVMDRAGREILRQEQLASGEHASLPFRFQWKPELPGLSFYQLEVGLVSNAGPTSTARPNEEATLANNRRILVVDRREGPHRILYVAGRPNWEYKFLHRSVEADPQLELVGLIRVARREARFTFRGRAGESSNPLFRGFANPGSEELERYDQPVLKRLNTRDELELAAGFPSTAEELYGYQAIIIDDVESGFFTPDQATLVQKFVSDRGGGLLMLGGMEGFREGQYARTPIGELLPVYLDRPDETAPAGPLRFQLTREGFLQEWARLRPTESGENTRIEAMPPFQVINRVREAKPGASVLATVIGPAGHAYPALVAQRFGKGRSAALTIGDFWRWGMQNPLAHEDLEKAWRQLLRWLVVDVPRRVELTIAPDSGDSPGSVRLQVRVRDPEFHPLDNATVSLEIEPQLLKARETGSTEAVRIQAESSQKELGLYEATFAPRLAAGYRAVAMVTNSVGAEVGRDQAGWSHDPASEEFRSLVPNRALLQQLAEHTGGHLILAKELDDLARTLPQAKAPVMETSAQPVWHNPWLFGFALACLIGEWGLRRSKGMP